MELVGFCLIIKHIFETIIRNWWLNKLGVTCYPCIHITFDMTINFWMPYSFFFWVHRLLPTLMALCFDFWAPIQCFDAFGLASNMLVKRHSDFLALFFNGVGVIGISGLLSVTPYGVDTIAASRISLRFCWPSNLPACWYIFFMLFVHFCSKE